MITPIVRPIDDETLTLEEIEYFRTYRKQPGWYESVIEDMQEPQTKAFLDSLQEKYGVKNRLLRHE